MPVDSNLPCRLDPLRANPRTHVDEDRSGDILTDGYAVLDQAQKPLPPDADPWAMPMSPSSRRGLSQPVNPTSAYWRD